MVRLPQTTDTTQKLASHPGRQLRWFLGRWKARAGSGTTGHWTSGRPQLGPLPRCRNRESARTSIHFIRHEPQRLPSRAPLHGQAVGWLDVRFGDEPQSRVIRRVAQHEQPGHALLPCMASAVTHQPPPDTSAACGRQDRERAEQRHPQRAADNRTSGRSDMADDPVVALGSERKHIGAAEKLTHERDQIFIREHIAIESLDRGGVARDGQPVPQVCLPQCRAPLQNRFNSRSM